MPTVERAQAMGRRDAWRIRQRLAQELRGARLAVGVSQAHVARIAGTSQSEVSRLELAQADRATFSGVARVCAVLGLRLDARTFPAGSPVRDAGQLRLVDRFRPDVHESFGWATEHGTTHASFAITGRRCARRSRPTLLRSSAPCGAGNRRPGTAS